MSKAEKKTPKPKKKENPDTPFKIDMTFEEAMKHSITPKKKEDKKAG